MSARADTGPPGGEAEPGNGRMSLPRRWGGAFDVRPHEAVDVPAGVLDALANDALDDLLDGVAGPPAARTRLDGGGACGT